MVLINKDVKCKQPFSFSFLLSFHFLPSILLPISCILIKNKENKTSKVHFCLMRPTVIIAFGY